MGWYDAWTAATIPTPEPIKPSGDEPKSSKPRLEENARILIEFFAGGGGVASGAVEAGIRPAIAVEFDPTKPELSKKLADMHGNNFSEYGCKMIRKTVQQVAEENFIEFPRSPDFLHASPVCSNFSNAKGANAVESDVDISAAQAAAKAIAILQPKIFTLENVPDYKKSKSFEIIKNQLVNSGYNFDFEVINFSEYGLPQARRRLILRASLGKLPLLPPKCDRIIGWYEAIADLIPLMRNSTLGEKQQTAVNKFLATNQPCPLLVQRTGARNKLHKIKEASLPCNTLTRSIFTDQNLSNRNKWADIWLPDGTVKSVSLAAAARLQGFPDWYEFSSSIAIAGSAIGYSVPPLFAAQLFRSFYNEYSTIHTRNVAENIKNIGTGRDDSTRNQSTDAREQFSKNSSGDGPACGSQSNSVQLQDKKIFISATVTSENLPSRHHLDFYESPHWFTTDTLKFVQVSGVVGECCSGSGAITSLLKYYPQIKKVWTNDIDPNKKTDYHLDATKQWNFPEADWIISNPPYGALAAPIIKNAFAHASKGVIMFLRHTWDEPCDDRAEWLAAHPPTRKIVFPRYKFRKDKKGKQWTTDSSTISAFIWDKAIACLPSITRPASNIWGFHNNPENAPPVDSIIEWIKSQEK